MNLYIRSLCSKNFNLGDMYLEISVFTLHGTVANEAPREKVFEIFMAYFLSQYHAEMQAEQMINKMPDDNHGDSPEFFTCCSLTFYVYISKFLTTALISFRADSVFYP